MKSIFFSVFFFFFARGTTLIAGEGLQKKERLLYQLQLVGLIIIIIIALRRHQLYSNETSFFLFGAYGDSIYSTNKKTRN